MSKVYRFTGPPENWITGVALGNWAVNDNNRNLWEKFEPGDIALLHSTARSGYSSKVQSSVIGYAVIASKKWIKDEPWWIQEKQAGQNMWPYVFSLDEVYLFRADLPIDFSTDMIEKSPEVIKREIEALSASGITITSLNTQAAQQTNNATVPNFPVNGSVSGVNEFYEHLILDNIDNYFAYQGSSDKTINERLSAELDAELATTDKTQLLADARAFVPPDSGYVTKEGVYVVRKDNERQKRIVAKLEDYTCQVCGFKCEYTRANGKPGWIIEIDHIIDKANGGTEELSNLWALCPNCHKKKTRGVISIDISNQRVSIGNELVAIRDNHLNW